MKEKEQNYWEKLKKENPELYKKLKEDFRRIIKIKQEP